MMNVALFLAHWMKCLTAVGLCTVTLNGWALEAPQGPVVLTVSGNITHTNVANEAQFDHAMLAALAQRTTRTSTPWHDQTPAFAGPLAHALMEAVGARGEVVRAVALNDYAADIPLADFERYPVILATHADGERLQIRDKGPLFIIYPFDENRELLNETIFMRSVWQVHRIEVK